MKKYFVILIVLSLLFVPVEAKRAGGGENVIDKVGITSSVQNDSSNVDCESLGSPKSRIKCRLDNPGVNGGYHESCRILPENSQAKCQGKYDLVKPCYEKNGKGKDRCLRQVSKFNGPLNSGILETEEGKDYALFLLYDLEEIVEERFDSNEIDSERASTLIDLIIEIKKMVVENESREIIKEKLSELRSSI